MLCYKCAKEGKEMPAVGICVVCGMGLCIDHVRIAHVTFTEISGLEGGGTALLGLGGRAERQVEHLEVVLVRQLRRLAEDPVPERLGLRREGFCEIVKK